MRNASGKKNLGLPVVYVSITVTMVAVAFGILSYINLNRDNVAMKINGEVITKDQLVNEMVNQAGQSILDNVIMEHLIVQEAEAKGVILTDEDIDAEIVRNKEELGGEEAYQRALASSGMTPEAYRNNTQLRLLIERILGPDIEISEADMKDYFENNKDNLGEPEQVRARHILVDTEEKALDIKERLAAGADFARLAEDESLDSGSAENGGDLGFFGRGRMVPEFEAVAFSLEPGIISDPVSTAFGYHIIKVEEKREAVAAVYDQVKEEVRRKLLTRALQERVPDWLNILKASAEVRTYVITPSTLPAASVEGERE